MTLVRLVGGLQRRPEGACTARRGRGLDDMRMEVHCRVGSALCCLFAGTRGAQLRCAMTAAMAAEPLSACSSARLSLAVIISGRGG